MKAAVSPQVFKSLLIDNKAAFEPQVIKTKLIVVFQHLKEAPIHEKHN